LNYATIIPSWGAWEGVRGLAIFFWIMHRNKKRILPNTISLPCYFLLNYARVHENCEGKCHEKLQLAIFFWIMPVKGVEGALEMLAQDNLLFSFELCSLQGSNASLVTAIFSLAIFFWIMLETVYSRYEALGGWHLAIFFWIMLVPQASTVKHQRYHYLLLFSFELCWRLKLDFGFGGRQFFSCYFLLNYAIGKNRVVTVALNHGLLFSFELCWMI